MSIIPGSLVVQAVTSGWYNGTYWQPGDIFVLNQAGDFSDSTVNYAGAGAGVQQYGWMLSLPASAPLFDAYALEAIPLFPVIDPVPPKRFVY